jgi:alkylation response protein AidB-like acyl-CoA dehydrogenase
MGYSAEMSVERGYRDSRINRIFEGTNEINRLLVVDTAMKRAMKGDFDLLGKAGLLVADLDLAILKRKAEETYFEEKHRYLKNFKNLILLLIHAASLHFDKKLGNEQEILNNLSDMLIEIYVAESMAFRIEKMEQLNGTNAMVLYKTILDVFIYDAATKIRKFALDSIYSFMLPDKATIYAKIVESATVVAGVNVKESRRKIADKLIEDNTYKF